MTLVAPLLVEKVTAISFVAALTGGNDWGSFYGGYIGGLLAGLFTYLGVRVTINYQDETKKEELRRNTRPYIHISEIYRARVKLENLATEKRKGRVLITKYYEALLGEPREEVLKPSTSWSLKTWAKTRP